MNVLKMQFCLEILQEFRIEWQLDYIPRVGDIIEPGVIHHELYNTLLCQDLKWPYYFVKFDDINFSSFINVVEVRLIDGGSTDNYILLVVLGDEIGSRMQFIPELLFPCEDNYRFSQTKKLTRVPAVGELVVSLPISKITFELIASGFVKNESNRNHKIFEKFVEDRLKKQVLVSQVVYDFEFDRYTILLKGLNKDDSLEDILQIAPIPQV